ncbi:MAG: autophagy protein 13 [Caeruleum heppii]|nr:MAG: autophagy protein 13 [Caeruleum heppii]
MHQHPRTPPVSASPASSPRTDSSRTQNTRDESRFDRTSPSIRTDGDGESSGSALDSREGGNGGDRLQAGPRSNREGITKLNQIVQNFFVKAALIIAQARVICPPSFNRGASSRRVNRWFNVEIDETDIFREDWRLWKTCNSDDLRPPSMVIETYLDTADLTPSQALVIVDETGRRYNVTEALNADYGSLPQGPGRSQTTQVILERWTIDLGSRPIEQPADLNAILPVVYKKSIVLFRSLYTYLRFLPAWKFSRTLAKLRSSHGAFRVRCRIVRGDAADRLSRNDELKVPLTEKMTAVTEDFSFGSTESPAGPFSVRVCYRTNCDLRVDDSEALLSSHFMGVDEHYFRPSLGPSDDREPGYVATAKDAGSLPSQPKGLVENPDRSQAYGSMSSFHQAGPTSGTSPLSALRAAREQGPSSPSSMVAAKPPPASRLSHDSKSSVRSVEAAAGITRRPSVSFMPFKSPSLSESPSYSSQLNPSSPRNSLGRTSALNALSSARNRVSIEPQSPSSLRQVPQSSEHAVASSSSPSPRPAPITRYTSSFGHRKGRHSSGGTSKTEDDNNSSGKGSLSSSAQPGSGMLAEGTGGSSGSVKTDDDNISDFLKMLDLKKSLKSFESPGNVAGADASSRRTSAALTKFQRMRDSNAALSESMSSSSMLHHRSSSSSSRQLSSVPPMVAGTSLSTSSSPGKPISPHTPHTPAIPSRLSANSIVEYSRPQRSSVSARSRLLRDDGDTGSEETIPTMAAGEAGTNAIDIPISPRPYQPRERRSSSVAQHNRALRVRDESAELFGIRSASVGVDDRPPLSLSALLGAQEAPEGGLDPSDRHQRTLEPSAPLDDASAPMSRQQSEEGSQIPRGSGLESAGGHYRPRIGGGASARASTPPHSSGSFSSFGGHERDRDRGSGSGSGTSDRPGGGRYSFTSRPGAGTGPGPGTGTFDEDEPLLFAMSEIGGHQSRRSIEDPKAGVSAVVGSSERAGPGAASPRRGSGRRGGSWT